MLKRFWEEVRIPVLALTIGITVTLLLAQISTMR